MPRGDFWPNWRERLASGYVLQPNGCHEWARSRNNKGYGVIWFDGKLHLAHRAAWLAAYGEWPTPGLVIDHTCENKGCVNPDHLRELTNRENVLRDPKSPMNVMAARTACSRDHEYTDESVRIDSKGHRQCRICEQIRAREARLGLV